MHQPLDLCTSILILPVTANDMSWIYCMLSVHVRASAATLRLMAKSLKPRITKMIEIDRNHVKSCYHIQYTCQYTLDMKTNLVGCARSCSMAEDLSLRRCLHSVPRASGSQMGTNWELVTRGHYKIIKAWAGRHWWRGHLPRKRMLQRRKGCSFCGTEVRTPGSTVGWKFT